MKIRFGSRELIIRGAAIRHPLDAMRNRLAEPAIQLRTRERTTTAPQ